MITKKDYFDVVYFPGVLYHLSDPIVALRTLYNALKIGGAIFVETFCHYAPNDAGHPMIYYAGERIFDLSNNHGYNYFLPNVKALERMLETVGFDEIQAPTDQEVTPNQHRCLTVARKLTQYEMCEAGLSRTDLWL